VSSYAFGGSMKLAGAVAFWVDSADEVIGVPG
jgi:hypothetical protein